MSVEALLQHPDKFNHLKVTVAGCYIKDFEKTVLGPCVGASSPDNSIWVDTSDYAVASASVTSDTALKPTLAIPSLSPQERTEYLRLVKQASGTSTSVVLEGEFQTTILGRYGADYRNRLILHRVLHINGG